MRFAETVPGIGEGRIKDNDDRVEFSLDIL
jgi:hypothetical protein